MFSQKTLATLTSGALFALLAWQFATKQEIWIDESTQLSGLTLNPLEVLRWLAGVDASRFGVPGDRMPPMSYWLGWTWAQAFGLSETSLRALSIVSVGGALMLVFSGTWRHFGALAATLCGLWLGLSPTFVTLGAEIRTYPFLLLCSAILARFTARLATSEGAVPKLAWLGATFTCAAACYAHYFGLALTGAAGLAWLYVGRERKLSIVPPLALGGAVAVCCLGLIPFIASAISASTAPVSAPTDPERAGPATSLARLLYRMLGGHPALAVHWWVASLVVLATAACLASTLATFRRQPLLVRALWISVSSGLGVATLAGFLTSKFDGLSVSYNCWLLPQIAWLLAASVPPLQSLARDLLARVRMTAAALAALGAAIGCVMFLANRSAFAHTPAERVAEQLASADPDLLVLHDQESAWAHLYFPLRYTLGPQQRQALVVSDSRAVGGVRFENLTQLQKPVTEADLYGKKLVVVGSLQLGYAELGDYIREGHAPEMLGHSLIDALTKRGCQVTSRQVFVAFTGAELAWLSCAPAP